MIKKYITYQLKQWLPYIILLFILLASVLWINAINTSMSETFYSNDGGVTYMSYNFSSTIKVKTGVSLTLAMGNVVACLLPFLVYPYRFSSSKSDTFLQLPFKEKQFRNIRILLGLVILLVLFTVSMWIEVLILSLNAAGVTTSQTASLKTIVLEFKYLYYLPVYLIALPLLAIEYLSNCYIVSQANNMLDAILYFLIFQLTCMMICCIPFTFFHFDEMFTDNTIDLGIHYFSLSMAVPINFVNTYFSSFIAQEEVDFSNNNQMFLTIFFIVYCVVHCILSAFAFIEKEPSGELSGKPGSRNIAVRILPHVFFVLLGFTITTVLGYSFSPTLFLELAVYILFYYVTMALLMRNIKLDTKTRITVGIIAVAVCLLVCTVPNIQISR